MLPPKYFYDDLGVHLFEAICHLPEYYLTRAESEILHEHVEEIIEACGVSPRDEIRLIELGNGSSDKTRHFIEALLRRQQQLRYVPIDISAASLEPASEELLNLYPQLRITAYAADYSTALQALARTSRIERPHPAQGDERNVVLFLGSSIGNLDADESRALLHEVRGMLHAGDALLLGADLKKADSVLVPAYDDGLGVTAAFNLNLLVRINRELGGEFDVKRFKHRAIYDEQHGRIEMHLVSREKQRVRINVIDLEASFDDGETIHTENSYKYDLQILSELARDTRFNLEKTWFDRKQRFSFNLFAAA